MNFNFSVSTTKYDRNNDDKRISRLEWVDVTGDIRNLYDYVINGYAFCNCFKHNEKTFTNKQKRNDNLDGASMIILDMDAVKLSMDDFIERMVCTDICPNFVYTSTNDGIFKHPSDKYTNRYRVIYVIDQPITDAETYSAMVDGIKKEISSICEDKCILNDMTDRSVSHFFAGNPDAETFINENIFSLSFFLDRYTHERGSINYSNIKGGEVFRKVNCTPPTISFKDELFKLLWEKGNEIEILTSMDKYYTNECTQIEYADGELYRELDADDYFEIHRKWNMVKSTGNMKQVPEVKKLKNGENRRKKIYLSLVKRRLIDETITLEHLCYAALYELHFFVDNTDNEDYITRKQLYDMAVNALNTDIEKYRETMKENKKYKINKMEASKRGLTVHQAIGRANGDMNKKKKLDRYHKMVKYFDPDKTNKENMDILKEHGFHMCKNTYLKFKREYAAKVKKSEEEKEIKEMYNDIKDIKRYLGIGEQCRIVKM